MHWKSTANPLPIRPWGFPVAIASGCVRPSSGGPRTVDGFVTFGGVIHRAVDERWLPVGSTQGGVTAENAMNDSELQAYRMERTAGFRMAVNNKDVDPGTDQFDRVERDLTHDQAASVWALMDRELVYLSEEADLFPEADATNPASTLVPKSRWKDLNADLSVRDNAPSMQDRPARIGPSRRGAIGV